MKLGNFLSDETKQALNDIRKSHSKEVFNKIAGSQKNKKEKAVSKPKDEKQNLNEPSAEDPLGENREEQRRQARKRRLLKILQKRKRKKEEEEARKRALAKKKARQKVEMEKRAENRLRVKKGYHGYSIETTNSIKAWSIPMGGLNKQ